MNQALIAAAVTVLGVIGTLLGIYLTVRGTTRSKEIDRRIAHEAQQSAERKEAYDQLQEDLKATREEARSLREELARVRTQMDEMWTRMAQVRAAAEAEIDAIRNQYRLQHEADEAHITILTQWIAERRSPPAPNRTRLYNTGTNNDS